MPQVFLSCSHLEITRGGRSLPRSTRFSILKTYCLRDELGSNRLQEKYGQMSRPWWQYGGYMVAVGWMLLKTVQLSRAQSHSSEHWCLTTPPLCWRLAQGSYDLGGLWVMVSVWAPTRGGPLVALYSLQWIQLEPCRRETVSKPCTSLASS